jgi:hypothetical protein
MTYLLCSILGSAVLGAICVPLFRKDNNLESAIIEETEWDLLQRKKEVILGNMQDLDFEHKCGKLSDQDYQRIRGEMTAEAGMVLQEIENIESARDLDALIRREISSRKTKSKTAAQEIACSACGITNPRSNKFCAECGAKLKH